MSEIEKFSFRRNKGGKSRANQSKRRANLKRAQGRPVYTVKPPTDTPPPPPSTTPVTNATKPAKSATKHKKHPVKVGGRILVPVAIGGGLVGAGAGALWLKRRHDKNKKIVSNAPVIKRQMTKKELAHRKRIQAATSVAGSTAGLTSLGLLGASAIVGRGKGKKAARQAMALKDKAFMAGSIGAGIGGVSGYNFAAIQRAEAKQQERGTKMNVGKRLVPAASAYGSSAFGIDHVAKLYDPEERRHKQTGAAAAGLGAIAAGTGYKAVENLRGAIREDRKISRGPKIPPIDTKAPMREGNKVWLNEQIARAAKKQKVARSMRNARLGNAGKWALVAVPAAAGAGVVMNRREKSKSYRSWYDNRS